MGCQKGSPAKEKCTAARKRYRNRCNKNEKSKKREEDSSPEKKRLKQNNDKDKKKEEEPKDQEQEKKDQDKIDHEKRESVTKIKKCIDCSENYEAEKKQQRELQCCFCEFSAHGCPIFKQQQISKGYVWFCGECRRMPNIFNLIFMVEERNRMANRIEELEKKDKISKDRIEELEKKDKISKDKKRKRNDSETIDNKKKN